jgi:hypothetical protein
MVLGAHELNSIAEGSIPSCHGTSNVGDKDEGGLVVYPKK